MGACDTGPQSSASFVLQFRRTQGSAAAARQAETAREVCWRSMQLPGALHGHGGGACLPGLAGREYLRALMLQLS